MKTIRLLYYSGTGNVHYFMKMLYKYSRQQYIIRKTPVILTTQITTRTIPAKEEDPFFVCVPTYVAARGEELVTAPLRQYLTYNDNASLCKGIVGNGDKAYGEMYCWTARLYSQLFDLPVLCDYEQRGTHGDMEKVYATLIKTLVSK